MSSLDRNESRKRKFGDDITNISFKRNKADSLKDGSSGQEVEKQTNQKDFVDEVETSKCSELESKQSAKIITFGPFAPVTQPKASDSQNNTENRNYDWESLASTYQPQYHNQGTWCL